MCTHPPQLGLTPWTGVSHNTLTPAGSPAVTSCTPPLYIFILKCFI